METKPKTNEEIRKACLKNREDGSNGKIYIAVHDSDNTELYCSICVNGMLDEARASQAEEDYAKEGIKIEESYAYKKGAADKAGRKEHSTAKAIFNELDGQPLTTPPNDGTGEHPSE